MKRVLAMVMAVVLLAGMTSMAAAEEKVKVSWMSWGHSRPQEIRNEALQAAFPEMAEKMEIEPIVGGQSVPDVADKMRMLLASGGNLPDIFQINSMMFVEFAAAGVCEDLSALYTQYEDQLLPGMKDLVTYEGKQYAFPYCVNTLMWFYRRHQGIRMEGCIHRVL